MSKVALCVDRDCLLHPEVIGLEGERITSQSWLDVYSNAAEMRRALQRNSPVEEVWVISSDDMEAINLAAALKHDGVSREIRLVSFAESGSGLSRAASAGLGTTLSKREFVERYRACKRRFGLVQLPTPDVHADTPPSAMDFTDDDEYDGLAEPLPPVPMPVVCQRGDKSAFIVTVVSGGGGAGKSAVSATMAGLAVNKGLSVLLLDADLQFGDLDVLTRLPDAIAIDEFVTKADVQSTLWSSRKGLALLKAPSRLEQAEGLAPIVPALLEDLSTHFDLIIVNTGSSWTELHASLVDRSSKSLFLVDQRASSVRACQHAVDLCLRCGLALQSFDFAVNRCGKTAPFTSIDISCALQGAHVSEIRDGGRTVEELLGTGNLDELIASHNEFGLSLATVLEGMLPPTLSPGVFQDEEARQGKRQVRRKPKSTRRLR